MLKHYVEFVYPGIIVSDTSVREVAQRGPVDMPEGAFGYRLFDREEQEINGETLRGKPKNHSAWLYQGEVWTLDRVRTELPNERILAMNMESNHWDRVVRTRMGQFINLGADDVVTP